ncbi:hypothetical protein [Ammoniphilus sp. YIM 78166]|uniref:hypothetical protein n=1 Tax=Ammoniphilus sp. YIM 78166 TaxID=1644106 RepID=UPI00106FAB07|nr:hypothetical protein [Ammoniphilus sp. YIM 78166]
MDLNMLQQMLNTVGDMLPRYIENLEAEFEKEHGALTDEQKEVFAFVQKKAKEFISQINPMG